MLQENCPRLVAQGRANKDAAKHDKYTIEQPRGALFGGQLDKGDSLPGQGALLHVEKCIRLQLGCPGDDCPMMEAWLADSDCDSRSHLL
jgi:hypothetical protein